MRASISFICSSVICPLLANFCRLVFIMFVPLSMKRCSMSRMVKSYLPICAATWVMPCPIRPAPKTVIFFTSIVVFSFGFGLGFGFVLKVFMRLWVFVMGDGCWVFVCVRETVIGPSIWILTCFGCVLLGF